MLSHPPPSAAVYRVCGVIFREGTLAYEKAGKMFAPGTKLKMSPPAHYSPHVLNPAQVLNNEGLGRDPFLGHLCFRGNPLEVRGEDYLNDPNLT